MFALVAANWIEIDRAMRAQGFTAREQSPPSQLQKNVLHSLSHTPSLALPWQSASGHEGAGASTDRALCSQRLPVQPPVQRHWKKGKPASSVHSPPFLQGWEEQPSLLRC
ncbi:hypothetical protein EYF80_046000 [Liparis tanakae]|uniref:Uncharacterized protein n=1 Tax=Liparis tanakae TaxID=230148 RepID=A0A4Z2FSQ3_9TELE|nr:hypothetical protein EYF80_046000 [Liparis tanakae]